MNFVGKPCAGKPHARFDEGGRRWNRLSLSLLYSSEKELDWGLVTCDII